MAWPLAFLLFAEEWRALGRCWSVEEDRQIEQPRVKLSSPTDL